MLLFLPDLLCRDCALMRSKAGLKIYMDGASVAEFDVEPRISNQVWESSHGNLYG
jgi:hypothetical protein